MQKKVLVIYKKSGYQLAKEKNNKKLLELIEAGDESVATMLPTHMAHQATLKKVTDDLSSFDLSKLDILYRADTAKVDDYDIVITVGGDGTFLWASKFVSSKVPMLGVNSAPDSSVGFFTAASAETFKAVFLKWRGYGSLASSSLSQKRLSRLKLEINGEIVQDRILNDVLFAAEHPGALTKYIFRKTRDGHELLGEEHRCSGIWISTAAGSTGANLSAGGLPLPLEDTRGQFVVREPMKSLDEGVSVRWPHGFFKKSEKIEITCKTRKAMLACDGTTLTFPATTGDRISVFRSEETLTILGK